MVLRLGSVAVASYKLCIMLGQSLFAHEVLREYYFDYAYTVCKIRPRKTFFPIYTVFIFLLSICGNEFRLQIEVRSSDIGHGQL